MRQTLGYVLEWPQVDRARFGFAIACLGCYRVNGDTPAPPHPFFFFCLVLCAKYSGLIANRKGIEAWTKKLIKEIYPGVKDVHLVTNRTRDPRDH